MKRKKLCMFLAITMLAVSLPSTGVWAEEFTDGTTAVEDSYEEEAAWEGDLYEEGGENAVDTEEEPEMDFTVEAFTDSDEKEEETEENHFASVESMEYDEDDEDDPDYDVAEKPQISKAEIVTLPVKSAYEYGTVKAEKDFDLTGLSIKVSYDDGHEETISFSRSRENKWDSVGNCYTCEIDLKDEEEDDYDDDYDDDYEDEDDYDEDEEEDDSATDVERDIVPGFYYVRIDYGKGTIAKPLIKVLPYTDTQQMQSEGNGIYSASVSKNTFAKFVPQADGKFLAYEEVVKEDYSYTVHQTVYDAELTEIEENDRGICELEKGKTYYIYSGDYGEAVYNLHVRAIGANENGSSGENVTWKVENGVMTISGSGAMTDYGYNTVKDWEDVEQVVIEEGVTAIGNYAFTNCKKLKSVKIAGSVQKIGIGAFESCVSLSEIFIPENVSTIGASAFYGTWQLEKIDVAEENSTYSSLDGILYDKAQTNLIFVPDGVTECKISSKVAYLRGIAVDDYEYISTASRFNVFGTDYSKLENIIVDENNPVLASEDGVLYTKDKSVLIACPAKKENLKVAEETKIISYSAVAGCTELVSALLPDGLERICGNAFARCTKLEEIVIPENLKYNILYFAFTSKNTLFKVYENTIGEEYAKKNGFKYEIIGTHTHTLEAEGTIRREPTCTEEGIKAYKCTTCGMTVEQKIPKTEHELMLEDTREATCSWDGYTGDWYCHICCNIIKKGSIIPRKEHNWGEGVVTKEATCTEKGEKTYTCLVGGETRKEEIPDTGEHKFSTKNEKNATCTEDGYTGDKICDVCGTVAEKGSVIPAAGHKYGDYQVTNEATIFAAGTEIRECAVCHNQESREIPKIETAVKLTAKTLPVKLKKSVSANALITDMDASDSIVSLKTSNAKVAAVNNKTFKITTKKAGKAVITVTMKSGASADITVNVKNGNIATTKITGIQKKVTLKKGKKLTLKPVLSPITSTDKVTYSSANKKIATVSTKGVIKAVKKGKVKITVKAGKKKVTCTVTVK